MIIGRDTWIRRAQRALSVDYGLDLVQARAVAVRLYERDTIQIGVHLDEPEASVIQHMDSGEEPLVDPDARHDLR